MARLSFDLLFLRRLGTLIRLLFPCQQRSLTIFLAGAVLIGTFIDQIATYLVGIVPSEFYDALGKRNIDKYKILILKAVLIILGKALVCFCSAANPQTLSGLRYVTFLLYLRCRKICDYALHRLYFKRHAFYKINNDIEKLDNPDQRMTQDVEKCTRIMCTELLGPVISAPFVIAYYTFLTYQSTGWMGPVSIFVYFLIATIINRRILAPIVDLVNEQERREGDFR